VNVIFYISCSDFVTTELKFDYKLFLTSCFARARWQDARNFRFACWRV